MEKEGQMLDKRLVKRALKGYAQANKWIEAERRMRLEQMTDQESWAFFDDAYRTWERMGKRAGGNWKALEEQQVRETIALRRTLTRLARRSNTRN